VMSRLSSYIILFCKLQINCRLFVFDGNTLNWVERGRGQLRLNDREEGSENKMQSRLIIRTKGSLRLMLNAPIWAGMNVERASDKSVRFTANDNGQMRVFLIMVCIYVTYHIIISLCIIKMFN